MEFSELTHKIAISSWFETRCFDYDLSDFGKSEAEQDFLAQIEDVANRTGANDFQMAKYILDLEKRLDKIEAAISATRRR